MMNPSQETHPRQPCTSPTRRWKTQAVTLISTVRKIIHDPDMRCWNTVSHIDWLCRCWDPSSDKKIKKKRRHRTMCQLRYELMNSATWHPMFSLGGIGQGVAA